MMRAGIALILLVFGAAPAVAETNWGIRELGKSPRSTDPVKQASKALIIPKRNVIEMAL